MKEEREYIYEGEQSPQEQPYYNLPYATQKSDKADLLDKINPNDIV